eukprot:2310245-Rhodomonas_salina.6
MTLVWTLEVCHDAALVIPGHQRNFPDRGSSFSPHSQEMLGRHSEAFGIMVQWPLGLNGLESMIYLGYC